MCVAEVHGESAMRAQKFGVAGHLQCTPCGGEEYGTPPNKANLSMLLPPTTAAHVSSE